MSKASDRLPGTGNARDDDELVPGNVDADVLEIVLLSTLDFDEIHDNRCFLTAARIFPASQFDFDVRLLPEGIEPLLEFHFQLHFSELLPDLVANETQ